MVRPKLMASGRALANPHRGQGLTPSLGRIHCCRLLPGLSKTLLGESSRPPAFFMDRQRVEVRVDALEPQLEPKRMLKMISEEFPQEALGCILA
jgi:hypothetical protein